MPRKAKRDPSLDVDWKPQADAAREKAAALPEGAEKERLLKLARQLDTACHMKDWITSPGLMPPNG